MQTAPAEGLRIVYAGYDFFSGCFSTLLARPDVQVVLCLTGEPAEPVGEIVRLAAANRVPVVHGRPTSSTVAMINELGADVLVSAAYSYRLPIDALRLRDAVNLHSTMLPLGRGPNPLPHLVDGQQAAAGVTLHRMDGEFDRGPVLIQRRLPTTAADGFDELSLRAFAMAPRLLTEYLERFPMAGSDQRADLATYWRAHSVEDRTIDVVHATMETATRLIRMFGASGVVVALPEGTRHRSGRVIAVACEHDFPVGSVVSRASGGWVIALRDGLIRLCDQ